MIIGDSMPGLVPSKKSVEEGGTSRALGGYVSRLLQGLIPMSCYIFPCIFSFFPVYFLVEDFQGKEGRKELVLWYMFSLHEFYLWQFWWIYWVISRHVFILFRQLLCLDMFGLGTLILGLVLLFFLVVFSSYFFIITCHIPVSFCVSFMYVSLLTTIYYYACLIGQ